jgi:3-methyladenine DNA glycosylase/8-oxoguanine DNA glycosylase
MFRERLQLLHQSKRAVDVRGAECPRMLVLLHLPRDRLPPLRSPEGIRCRPLRVREEATVDARSFCKQQADVVGLAVGRELVEEPQHGAPRRRAILSANPVRSPGGDREAVIGDECTRTFNRQDAQAAACPARNVWCDETFNEAMAWSAELELRGAGGEPVDFLRTIASHGLSDLPPQVLDEEARTLETTVPLPRERARTIRIRPSRPGFALVEVTEGRVSAADGTHLAELARHILRLDADLSGFYEAASHDPDLAWVTAGAGRMLRSPTVFEDVVKTICTTNCAWSATVRMVSALVSELGIEAPDGRRAFPLPAAMASAGEDFYRDTVRAGYRGPYLHSLATSVADGALDLEALNDPELPDDEVAAELLALPGCGPYACAHMMMLLGRYSRLILDSWTRPKYARLKGRKASDKTIERRFRRYRDYTGLAFWLYLTRDWVDEQAL